MGSSLGKSSAAPAPDYADLAAQQGAASQQAAQYNTAANRVNQTGPDGSITWSSRPGADPNNPQAGDWTQTTSLSPQQQQLYNSQNRISQQFANTAEGSLGRISGTMSQDFNPQGLPALQGAQQGQFTAQAGAPNSSVDSRNGNMSQAPQAGPVQGQVNAGNLPALGGDYEASRNAVTQALMARAQPGLDQNQSATENRLKNQGIEQGSEAWNREMQNLGQQRNDAQSQAILAGGQEQSRLAGLAQADRSQLYGEGVTSGNFANQAQNQQYTQGLAGSQFNADQNQAAYSRDLGSATFGNQAQGQNFAQAQSNDAARNTFNAQQAQFGNQARSQGFQEQLTQRQLPINEINALRGGSQVSQPQFSSYYTGGSTQAAPVFDAGVAAGNYATQAGAQNQSGKNALLGGLASLGSAWIGS